MTVQINFDRSSMDSEAGVYSLVLENPEKGGVDSPHSHGTFRGYTDGGPDDETWWRWENPDDPLEDVTFSPSIILHYGDAQQFHVFVRDGEIDHCGDCECGCQ